MKKFALKIFFALALIGMTTIIAPKEVTAVETAAPDCITISFKCPDGSEHGCVIICNGNDILLYLDLYCNIQISPIQD